MRVLVVGSGIIGSIYGWALAAGGQQVVHLLRPGRAAALREGLGLDLLDRRKGRKGSFRGVYRLNATEALSPTDNFELIAVPTKHYTLVPTLEQIVPRAGAADFLLLTQNWCGTSEIDSILPRSRYVYGDAKAGGAFSGNKLVAALKAIDLGSPEGPPTALAKKVAGLFSSAAIPATLHSDMLHYLWVQYAMTCGPWAALVHAGSFDRMVNDLNAGYAALQAGRECLEVVRKRGVDLSKYPETKPFLTDSALLKRVTLWFMRRKFLHDEYIKRCSSHALGDPVEVNTFYDDLISTGRQLGVSMPVMGSYGDAIRRFAEIRIPGVKQFI